MTTNIQSFGGNVAIGTSDSGGNRLKVSGSMRTENLKVSSITVGGQTNVFIPPGCIGLWSATGTLPDGWVECDGTNGTPDLRTRYVIGANPTYTKGTMAGNPYTGKVATPLPYHRHVVDITLSHGPHNHTYQINRTSNCNNREGIMGAYAPSITSFYSDAMSYTGRHSHTVPDSGQTGASLGTGYMTITPPTMQLRWIMKT